MSHITVDGFRVNYEAIGRGPDVLLIHGWVSSLRMWQRTLSHLASAGYHAVAIDLIGFGDSGKPPTGWYTLDNYTSHLIALCDRLGLQRPALVGHSMGATIALAFASRMEVSAVAVGAPVVDGQLGLSLHQLLTAQTTRRMFAWMQTQPLLFRLGDLHPIAAPRLMRDPVRRRNQEDLQRATMNSTIGSLKAVVDQSIAERLRHITAPTLIIMGGRDLTVKPSQGRLAARLIPRARLIEWPTVGHSMVDDRGDEFDKLLIDHLRTSTAAFPLERTFQRQDWQSVTSDR